MSQDEPGTAGLPGEEDASVDAAVATKKAGLPPPNPWWQVLVGFGGFTVAAGLCVVVLVLYLKERPFDLVHHTRSLADAFEEVLLVNRVPAQHIRRTAEELRGNETAKWFFHEFEVAVPSPLSLDGVERLVRRYMTDRGASVSSWSGANGRQELSLSFAGREFMRIHLESDRWAGTGLTVAHEGIPAESASGAHADLPPVELPRLRWKLPDSRVSEGATTESTGPEPAVSDSGGLGGTQPGPGLNTQSAESTDVQVAIIVDDGGYGGPATEAILALPPVLTLAILPGTKAAEETARRAIESGFEVILHMPLESGNPDTAFPGEITTGMARDELRARTAEALGQIPGATGMNYHTGSKFAADGQAMVRFLEFVKEQGLYFVDSRTEATSVAFDTAKRLGIPAAVRNVFLDNEQDTTYIRGQFDHLIAVGEEQGHAVGICHFRPTTAEVLTQVIPELQQKGIRLVPVSKVLQ